MRNVQVQRFRGLNGETGVNSTGEISATRFDKMPWQIAIIMHVDRGPVAEGDSAFMVR